MYSQLRSLARWCATRKGVGPVLAAGLQGVGAVHLGRRVARLNGAVPPDIAVLPLPAHLFDEPSLSMHTVGGRDQFAVIVWTKGWTAYETPRPEVFSAAVRGGDVVPGI